MNQVEEGIYEMNNSNEKGTQYERKYFTQIPNMIDDLSLSVYAVRLYLRIKRRAGDNGVCFESTDNLSKGCNMAKGTISKAKKELVDAGLISIEKKKNPHGGKDYDYITVNNVWDENLTYYTSSPHELANSSHELASSPGEIKKNPSNKNTNEEVEIQKDSLLCAPRGEKESSFSSTSSDEIHPAIEAIAAVTGAIPPKNLHGLIIQELGEKPDKERLQEVYNSWTYEGHNPKNLRGIIDWYKNGIPERKPKRQREKDAENPNIVDEDPLPENQTIDWCPEELRDLAARVIFEAGIYPYEAAEKKKWIKELRRFRDHGIQEHHVKKAISHMQDSPNHMVIASPKSIYATALNMKSQEELWSDDYQFAEVY